MFRTVDSAPEYYLQSSRDFQYITRILDMWFLGFKYSADTISNTGDPLRCPDSYLPALREKLGFYPQKHIPNDDLRIILKAFPWMCKYKGTRKAIDIAVRIGLLINGIDITASQLKITINNMAVEISTAQKIDETAIREMFRHIAPVGYAIDFVVQDQVSYVTEAYGVQNIRTVRADALWGSQIWGSGDEADVNGGVKNYQMPVVYKGPITTAEIQSIEEVKPSSIADALSRADGVVQRLMVDDSTSVPTGAMFNEVEADEQIYLQEDVSINNETVYANTPLPKGTKIPENIKFTTNIAGCENMVFCVWHECVGGQWWRVVARCALTVIDTSEGWQADGVPIGEEQYWFRNILGIVEVQDPSNANSDDFYEIEEVVWE